MGGNNELKFGFGVPRASRPSSGSSYNGNMLVGVLNGTGPGEQVAKVFREPPGRQLRRQVLERLHRRRAVSKDRFTFNLGVRWDGQTAKNLDSEVPANATFSNLLPALAAPGDRRQRAWSGAHSRRASGLSYAFDESRKTVLRASYAGYSEQLAFGEVGRREPGRP